jgi:hypothetical protein
MKPLQVVFISLMLAGTVLLAQSDRVSLTNQENGLSAAEPPQSGLRANSSEIPQGGLFPQTAGARVQVQANPSPHSQHLRIKSQVQTAPVHVSRQPGRRAGSWRHVLRFQREHLWHNDLRGC